MTSVTTYFKQPRVEKRKHRMKSERELDDKHLANLRKCSCVACGSWPTDAAHVRMTYLPHGKRNTPLGQKPSDRWALPLCRKCHERQHRVGERSFWHEQGLNPILICLQLYLVKDDLDAMRAVVRNARRDV